MNEISSGDPVTKRIVLEELRRAFDNLSDANNSLDTKLYNILSLSSLIVSLVGTLQVAIFQQKLGTWFWVPIGLVTILYIAMFALILRALAPKTHLSPISTNWDEMNRVYFGKNENAILTQMISDHLAFMETITKINLHKATTLRRTSLLLFSIVLILVAMLIFNLLAT